MMLHVKMCVEMLATLWRLGDMLICARNAV